MGDTVETPVEPPTASLGEASAEALLQASEERYRTLFESIGEGVALCEVVLGDDGRPVDYRVLDVNPAYETVSGLTREQVIGRLATEIVPGLEASFVETYGRVAVEREPARFESRIEGLGLWLSTYAFPVGEAGGGGFAVVLSDVSERRAAEEALRASAARAMFRAALADALRPLTDPVEVQAVAGRVLGEHLGATRVYYAAAATDGRFVIARDYHDGVPSAAGTYTMDDFGPAIAGAYRAGQTHAVADVVADDSLTAAEQAAYAALGVRAHIGVPVVKGGRLVGLLGGHQAEPRAWTAEEVALVEETAERTWAAVERARSEDALRESEARYRTLFESIDEGFVECEMIRDADGKCVDFRYLSINPAWEKMTGLTVAQVLGRTVREAIPGIEEFWVETYARLVETGEPTRFENFVAPLGRWLDVYAFPRGGDRFAAIFTDVTQRRLAEREREHIADEVRAFSETLERRVAERTLQVRRLAARLAVAEQEERQRIAHVLHDDLQQQLYGLSMVLALLQRAPDPATVTGLSARAAEILDGAAQGLRSLATELSPSILQAVRLAEVLEWTAEEARARHALDVAVEVTGDPQIADAALRILMYQSLREVLFNVVKHADVPAARLVAWAETDAEGTAVAVVRVEDDGAGFDAASSDRPGGFGLFSVRERIHLVGGRFEVESSPGGGTRVTVAVPSGALAPESP